MLLPFSPKFSQEVIQLLTTFWCCFWICTLLAIFIWSGLVAALDGWKQLRRLHQIPCHKCLYFTGDYNLKCTVRPCEALTESAIACRDFEALEPCKPRPPVQPIFAAKKHATSTLTSTNLHRRIDKAQKNVWL